MERTPKSQKARRCCVFNCPNSSNSPGVKLYRFPTCSPFFPLKKLQREAWIKAVSLKNPDGSVWAPTESTRICSAHFIGNQKSEDYVNPAYNPTIFPAIYKNVKVNSQAVLAREDDQIVGSYLVIEEITLEDYGEYMCQVSNGVDDDDIKLPAHLYRQEPQFSLGLPNGSWRKSLLLSVLVLVLLFSAAAFYARCWLPLVLLCRDKFAPLEENDGKECDALVCYHEKDSNLVVGIVIPTLETRHRYKCASLELSNFSQHWNVEISPYAATARRVVVVLSPESLSGSWTESSVGHVLKQLSSVPTRTIVVALKEPPCSPSLAKCGRVRRDLSSTPANNQTVSKMTAAELLGLEILRWREPNERKFWYRLRLALPPVRPASTDPGCQSVAMIVQANAKNSQQKARSRESLEVLV